DADEGLPKVPWAKVHMLVGLYAPELSPVLQGLVVPTKEYTELLVEMIAGFRDDGTLSADLPGGWRMEMLNKLTTGQAAIARALDVALDDLRAKAARLRQRAGELARLD